MGSLNLYYSKCSCVPHRYRFILRLLLLTVADILMGIYLLIIGIEDFRYRERFQELANEWVFSWRCVIAGVLAMVSSEVSMLILAFMSVERFLLISNPFGQRCITGKNVIVCLITIWVVGVMLAVTPGTAKEKIETESVSTTRIKVHFFLFFQLFTCETHPSSMEFIHQFVFHYSSKNVIP